MSARKAKARLFVEADLTGGATLALGRAQSRYLTQVMRLGGGDRVQVFNGRDGEWRAEIEAAAVGRCLLRVGANTRPQDVESDLWLVFAPLKKTATDFVVGKATELGVSRLLPVVTRNTQTRRVNRDRLLANAVEAAEQCERMTVPEVAAPVPLERLIDGWPRARRLLFLDEGGTGAPIAQVLSDKPGAAEPCAVLSGPEGGFAGDEVDALCKLPFVSVVALGPRVLRAETAALAALACWQALVGDWRDRTRSRPHR